MYIQEKSKLQSYKMSRSSSSSSSSFIKEMKGLSRVLDILFGYSRKWVDIVRFLGFDYFELVFQPFRSGGTS